MIVQMHAKISPITLFIQFTSSFVEFIFPLNGIKTVCVRDRDFVTRVDVAVTNSGKCW